MNKLFTSSAATLAAIFLIANPAFAQDDGDPGSAGPTDRFGSIGGVTLQLNADSDDDRGSVALELPLNRTQPWRFGLILSSPLNDDKVAMPATLDGLANGTKLTLRIGRFELYPFVGDTNARANQIEAEARANCRIRRERDHASPEDVAKCDTERPTSNIIGRYASNRLREYNAMLTPRAPRDFGFEASVSVHDFDFIDPASLAAQSDRKTQWSISGHYTQYFRQSRTALSFSVGYERAYEAADEEVFCPANPNNVIIRCVTASGAPPDLNESLLLSVGLRHHFASDGILRHLAVAPTVTYDALDDVVGVDLPIYFLSNSEGTLTGGIRAGYRSDRDHRFSVGIFIGTSFGLVD
jgi:hypothetical protein